jgi:hypothetical protein
MRYALKNTENNETLRHQEFEGDPPQLAPAKGLKWVSDPLPEPEPPTQEQLDEMAANAVRAERDERIRAIEWRILRHQRQVRMGITPTEESVAHIDQYIQDLADVPAQAGFPHEVIWPNEP